MRNPPQRLRIIRALRSASTRFWESSRKVSSNFGYSPSMTSCKPDNTAGIGGLCQSLPGKLHAHTAPTIRPAYLAAQLPYQTQATARQTVDIQRPRQHLLHIKPRTAVFNAQGHLPTCPDRHHLHMHPYIPAIELREAVITLTVILGKPLGVTLEPRVQTQDAVLQGIGIQLRHHAVERPTLLTQPMNLQQQLQQIRQRVVTLQGLGAKLENSPTNPADTTARCPHTTAPWRAVAGQAAR
ncbi:hypothetical protein Ddc_21855 [Ditylenchus destructor]|nr:hypothetical protein Ddc_21855 [Ditylenchus destructor]